MLDVFRTDDHAGQIFIQRRHLFGGLRKYFFLPIGLIVRGMQRKTEN